MSIPKSLDLIHQNWDTLNAMRKPVCRQQRVFICFELFIFFVQNTLSASGDAVRLAQIGLPVHLQCIDEESWLPFTELDLLLTDFYDLVFCQ